MCFTFLLYHDQLSRQASTFFNLERTTGAGISLDGSVVSIDDSANENVYGKPFDVAAISANKPTAKQMSVVGPFLVALQKYVTRSEIENQAVK